MDAVIYTNEAGDLLAKKYARLDEFDVFMSTLKESEVLYYNGKIFEDNIPEKHKTEFPSFLKSMKKQWGGSHQQQIEHQLKGIEIFVDEVPVEVTKKASKPRKKKEK